MKKSLYTVPRNKQIRVIIDSDCDCEADDQYAIAHALMTPKFDVIGIIAAHFGKEGSEERSYREIHKVLDLMGIHEDIKVLHGCQKKLSDEKTYIESEGSRFIVEEALKEDSRPLFVVCQGAKAAFYPGGESWQLGDSPVVGLMLLDHNGHYDLLGAPRFNQDGTYILRNDNTHKIRVYHYVDSNFILNDFYAKLKYHYG